MTATEVVQGADGRLYLVLRKVDERHYHDDEYDKSEVVIDTNEDIYENAVVEFYLK